MGQKLGLVSRTERFKMGIGKISQVFFGQIVTFQVDIPRNQSEPESVTFQLFEDLLKISQPNSELNSSKERVLKRSPGNSDVQANWGIQR